MTHQPPVFTVQDYTAELAIDQIVRVAQRIEDSPHPQAVIDLLRDHVFGAHIGAIMMLQYGPVHESGGARPFEYFEMVGTWSRRYGSGVGTGMRLSIRKYQNLIEEAEANGTLVFSHTSEIRHRLDPLARGLMRGARLRSLAYFPLGLGARKLGAILIGTDHLYQFSDPELNHYRTIFSVLAISLRAQLLRQQRDRVQHGRAALLDAVTDGVVMVVPGGRGGSVLTVNERFTGTFGVSEGAADGMSLVGLLDAMHIPEGVRADLRQAWLSSPMQDPNILHGDFSMIGDDGRAHEFTWYSAPVYQGSVILGRIFTFHDVTAERTASRLRAAFISRVSHELRTPLTSIKGFAEFILEASGDDLPPIAREYTQIIFDSAKHLTRIFSDIIELSRADAGELQLRKEVTSLTRIVRDVAGRMKLTLQGRGQSLHLDIDDTIPNASVDTDRLIQVITNLIANAGKYAPENSTITVRAALLKRGDALPFGAPADVLLPAALITVQDEGRGVSNADADKIFLPFFRTEEAKRNRIEGVGLGLSVTRSLVEMHQGKIWAVGREAVQGGCFQFTIPVRT
ncbi:MAG: ATP-binding protein [bacterium]|nr:ATP-binding protein [bacterium]